MTLSLRLQNTITIRAAARMRELAYLNRGISITITDDRNKDENGNCSPKIFTRRWFEGICTILRQTRQSFIPEVIYMEGSKENVVVEVVFQYNDLYNEKHTLVRKQHQHH